MISYPLSPEKQESVLSDIRTLVPNGSKNATARRHIYLVGVVLGLQAVDHALVPPAWLMCVMSHTTERLFAK